MGINVRIDAQCHFGPKAHGASDLIDLLKFTGRFNIKHQNIGFQCILNFFFGFADSGEDDFVGCHSGLQGAEEFSTRHDVCATPFLGEETQDGQVRIRFHGKGHDMWNGLEGLIKSLKMSNQCPVAINVAGSPHLCGNLANGDLLTE